MGSYYEHKRKLSVEIPYSFCCESCGKDSGPMNAHVEVEATVNNQRKQLNQKEEDTLKEKTEKLLSDEVRDIHKDVSEKNVYPVNFVDKCPHCGAPQSWAVSGLKKKMYSTPSVILLVGIFIGVIGLIGGHADKDMAYMTPTLCFGIMGLGAVAALVSLLINMAKIRSKTKATSGSMGSNKPNIQWEAVQHIMDGRK